MQKPETKNAPEKHIRFGGVRISIWKDIRKGPKGSFETRSVTIDRAYKDANGQWQNTNSLRDTDVPKVIAALSKAYMYLNERESEDTEKSPGMGEVNFSDV